MDAKKTRRDEREPKEPRLLEAPDSERQLLIAILEYKAIPPEAEDLLPEELSHPREQRILRAVRELDRSGNLTLDALTERLTKGEAEGVKPEEGMAAYLSTLAGETAVPSSLLSRYVAQIKNAARDRDMRLTLGGAMAKLGEEDTDTLVRRLKEKLEEWEATPSADTKPVSARLENIYECLLDTGTKPVPTFSKRLNKNLNGGLQRGKVLTIAAPAGAGKTTFALQLIEETVVEQSKQPDAPPCVGVYVSMEVSEEELVAKSLSRLGKLDSGRIEEKTVGKEALGPAMKRYGDEIAPVLYIVEARDGMTLDEVRSITRKIKARLAKAAGEELGDPFVVLCVDPFQRLLTGNPAIDSEEISRVGTLGSGLKKLARDLGVAVILPADTTKDVARRVAEGGRAGVAAVRGSYMATHTTDQQAEIIAWDDPADLTKKLREKYTSLMEDYPLSAPESELDFDRDNSAPAYAVLHFSKNRSGGYKPCLFVWQRAYNRFIPVGDEEVCDEDGDQSGERREAWARRWGVWKVKRGEK